MANNLLVELNHSNPREDVFDREFDKLNTDFNNLSDFFSSNPYWLSLLSEIKNISLKHHFNYFTSVGEYISKFDNSEKIINSLPPFSPKELFTAWIGGFNSDKLEDFVNLKTDFDYLVSQEPEDISRRIFEMDFSFEENTYEHYSNEIYLYSDNLIKIGQYSNKGVFFSNKENGLFFDGLYNCAPLIALVEGDDRYVSFLHVWSGYNPDLVDTQVFNWLKKLSNLGTIKEAIFAPRKSDRGVDTNYVFAKDFLRNNVEKTIFLNRHSESLSGFLNTSGVYFNETAYHLWDD